MKSAFSQSQYELYYPPGIELHWWTLARNRLLAKILGREADDTAVYLEVGCGRGLVVKSLRDSGFNIHGVELADVEPFEGAQLLVDTGTDAFELPVDQRAEVTGILLLDVIEHLPEPESFLKKLECSFPKLSLVVITAPARQEIWSNYDSTVGHYRRYSLAMLAQIAEDLQWSVQSSGYFFRLPYLLMRWMAWFGVDRTTKFDSPRKFMQPIHRLVSTVCALEQAFVPRKIRGSSAYAVYRLDRDRASG